MADGCLLIKIMKTKLSERESEVFNMMMKGKSNIEIARELLLSTNTISTFKKRIFEKKGFKNNMEMIKYS